MNDSKSTVSVVVATYNGEKYIIEQLDSIRMQSFIPTEVIIRDDCSTDRTYEMVKKYIDYYRLENWKLLNSDENVGWKRNFRILLEKTSCDIVFLCDQDDIWKKSKIETIVQVMDNHNNIELIASDYQFYIDGKEKNKFCPYLNKLSYKKITPGFNHLHYPGAVYAMRRSLLESVMPYWNDEIPHDAQIWAISCVRHSIAILHEKLIFYRRHQGTVTGRDRLDFQIKLRNLYYEEEIMKLIHSYILNDNTLSNREMRIIRRTCLHQEYRYKLITDINIVIFVKTLMTINYYTQYKTFIGDCIIGINNRKVIDKKSK